MDDTTTTPKKRGRKPTGQAKTAQQRQADWRARQRQHIDELEARIANLEGKGSAPSGEPVSTAAVDCRQCAELRAELEATRAMLEQYKRLDSDQKRELAALDLQLERYKRAAKIEENRLKRELDEAHKSIESHKRELLRVTKKG
jgi:hypothetical protein